MLETIGLASLSPKRVTPGQFAALCEADHADGTVYICRTTTAGSANCRIVRAMPENDESCQKAVQYLGRPAPHLWEEEFLVLCNFPCYLVTGCGTVITRDAKVIAESLYPSAGDRTYERFLDVEVPTGRLEDVLSRSGKLATTRVCSSFLSRWSRVYFHMLSESLVQDYVLSHVAIKQHVTSVIATELNGIQRKLVEFLCPDLERLDHQIVEVPRALYSSVTHRHATLGLDFRMAIERIRLAVTDRIDTLRHVPSPKRIYVTREGESQRPLHNEAAVRQIFEEQGFSAVQPATLSLLEQAKLFSNAAVVVGPHGAGLANAAFAMPNALVFEFRGLNRKGDSPAMNESYRKISAVMGFRYGFLLVPNETDSDDWTAPEDQIAAIAKQLKNQ